jgi:hypothetical protein
MKTLLWLFSSVAQTAACCQTAATRIRRERSGSRRQTALLTAVLGFFLFASSAFSQPGSQNDPVVTFSGSRVTASGITRGKEAVFFGIGFSASDGTSQLIRWKVVVSDDDRDGTVSLDVGTIPLTGTVWAVVDLTNAQYAVAAAPNTSYGIARTPQHPLRHGKGSAQIDQFVFDHPLLEMLYVHPGLGAWVWSGRNGATDDATTAIGMTVASLADAKPIAAGREKAPKAFVPGGVIIAIDWYKVEVLALHVSEATLAGAP